MEMDFIGAFKLEYGWMVDFSRLIVNVLRDFDVNSEITWIFFKNIYGYGFDRLSIQYVFDLYSEAAEPSTGAGFKSCTHLQ